MVYSNGICPYQYIVLAVNVTFFFVVLDLSTANGNNNEQRTTKRLGRSIEKIHHVAWTPGGHFVRVYRADSEVYGVVQCSTVRKDGKPISAAGLPDEGEI